MTMWRLATTVDYRTLSELFGMGQSTVGGIAIETCNAIATHLLPQYVYTPKGEQWKEIVDGLETCCGFPLAAGASDGSHVPFYVQMRVHLIITIVKCKPR